MTPGKQPGNSGPPFRSVGNRRARRAEVTGEFIEWIAWRLC